MIKRKTYIISEIGINHNGEYNKVKKLIYLSKKAGADAVKFQLFSPEILGNKNIKSDIDYLRDLKRLVFMKCGVKFV